MSRSGNDNARIYVGNLPPDVRTKDVEDLFSRYGSAEVDLKNRKCLNLFYKPNNKILIFIIM